MSATRRWSWLVALVLYVALAVGVTWPVAQQFSTHVAGFPGRDSLQYTWSLWWSRQAWLQGMSPSDASLIYRPWRAANPLLGVAPMLDGLALPLYALLTPTQVYNTLFLTSLVLSAMAMYWLALDRTHSQHGAMLAGAVFAFAAPRMGHALLGHLTHLAAWWLPLALLFGCRTLERPRPVTAILCGLLAGLGMLVAPVVAAYLMAPGLLLVLGLEAIRRRQQLARRHLLMALVGLATTVLVIAPTYGPFIAEALSEGHDLAAEGVALYSVDPAMLVLPSPYHPLWGRLLQRLPLLQAALPEPNDLERIAYLGLAPLAMALYGSLADLRGRWPWLVTLLVAVLLAMGPALIVVGRATDIPMPYALLQRLPLFAWGRTPERLLQLAGLAVAMLAAYAVSSLRLKPWMTGVLLAVCVLGSLTIWPFPEGTPTPPPEVSSLAHQEGLVLDLPISKRQIGNLAMYYQTEHGRPIIGGYIHRDPPGQRAFVKALDEALLGQARAAARPLTAAERRGLLQGLDVRQVLVHREYVRAEEVAQAADLLSSALGAAPQDWGAVLALDVPAAPPTGEALASFGDGTVELRSVEHRQEGAQLWVTLEWQAAATLDRDWSVFVHLVDDHGVRLAQSDSQPAAGNWPMSLWAPGTRVTDEHSLSVDVAALQRTHLEVGLYDASTGERLAPFSARLETQHAALVLPLSLR